jgi:hypothetical protein
MTDKLRALLYIATGGILTLAIGSVVYLGALYLNSLRPNYLNFTYLQPIKQVPPVFHLKDPIQVEALFYNTSSEPIDFTALVFWTHGDKQILQFAFQRTLKSGCSELNFDNFPPEEVKTITQDLFKQGQKEVTWRIEGHNAVTNPYSGGLQPFRVEEATYIPDTQPLPERKVEDNLRC